MRFCGAVSALFSRFRVYGGPFADAAPPPDDPLTPETRPAAAARNENLGVPPRRTPSALAPERASAPTAYAALGRFFGIPGWSHSRRRHCSSPISPISPSAGIYIHSAVSRSSFGTITRVTFCPASSPSRSA